MRARARAQLILKLLGQRELFVHEKKTIVTDLVSQLSQTIGATRSKLIGNGLKNT